MRNRTIVILKVLVHLACLIPLAILARDFVTNNFGPDPTATVAHITGFAALRILVISLAITPVRRLSLRLGWLVRFRRMLGLYAFFYATLHLAVYLTLYASLDWATIVDDLTRRRYIIVGFAAWLLLVPLAATSTKWSIRKLGGKRWQALHRLAYLAAFGGVVHYWWIVKKGVLTPVTITLILMVLLLSRGLWLLLEARRRRLRTVLS